VTEGFTVWFTGLSGAGKTTLARALERRLRTRDRKVAVLDGDELRRDLCADLGFSRRDREINIQRVASVAALLAGNGVAVLTGTISPYRSARDLARQRLSPFVEVYCRCSLAAAEQRDVKGLYRRARAGLLPSFTGVDDCYEEPLAPEVTVYTDTESIDASLDRIWLLLEARGYVPRHPAGGFQSVGVPAPSSIVGM
jgi:adenylylsulfate kinase